MTRSARYQLIFNGLKFTLHRAHVLNNVVITTAVAMVEMVEILDGRVDKRSVERVRYVINNLLHLVIVKYGVISLVLYQVKKFLSQYQLLSPNFFTANK